MRTRTCPSAPLPGIFLPTRNNFKKLLNKGSKRLCEQVWNRNVSAVAHGNRSSNKWASSYTQFWASEFQANKSMRIHWKQTQNHQQTGNTAPPVYTSKPWEDSDKCVPDEPICDSYLWHLKNAWRALCPRTSCAAQAQLTRSTMARNEHFWAVIYLTAQCNGSTLEHICSDLMSPPQAANGFYSVTGDYS